MAEAQPEPRDSRVRYRSWLPSEGSIRHSATDAEVLMAVTFMDPLVDANVFRDHEKEVLEAGGDLEDLGRTLVCVASSEGENRMIEETDFPAFFVAHDCAGCVWVLFDLSSSFRRALASWDALHVLLLAQLPVSSLASQSDIANMIDDGKDAFWEAANANRLRDPLSLHHLVTLAQSDSKCKDVPLEILVEKHTGLRLRPFFSSIRRKIRMGVRHLGTCVTVEELTHLAASWAPCGPFTGRSSRLDGHERDVFLDCGDEEESESEAEEEAEEEAEAGDRQDDESDDKLLANETACGAPMSREELEARVSERARARRNVAASLEHLVLVQAVATLQTYRCLSQTAEVLAADCATECFPGAREKFGALTEYIQAKAAIAVGEMRRCGIHVNHVRAQALLGETIDNMHDHARALQEFPLCRRLFTVRAGGALECLVETMRAKDGLLPHPAVANNAVRLPSGDMEVRCVPRINEVVLQEVLRAVVSEIEDEHGIEILGEDVIVLRKVSFTQSKLRGRVVGGEAARQSMLKQERYTTDTTAWSPFVHLHPILGLWIRFQRSIYQYQAARRWYSEGWRVTMGWRHMSRNGRCKSYDPDIQRLNREPGFRHLIQPAPGHVLLVVDYSYIQLCSLAEVCLFKFGYSMLAKVIADGVDPHCFTAALFSGMLLHEFVALKESEEEEERAHYRKYRSLAKVLNFGIASGLGSNAIVANVRDMCGASITKAEAKAFKRKLIKSVYPEISLNLHQNYTDILAANLGVPVGVILSCRVHRKYSRATEGALRRLLAGKPARKQFFGAVEVEKWERRVLRKLLAVNRNRKLVELLDTAVQEGTGSPALADEAFALRSTTLTGRSRPNLSYTQKSNSSFSSVASDGAKLALWNLTHVGYRVIAFIHDEFLIEVPIDSDLTNEVALVEQIVCESMQDVLPSIPIRAKSTVATCWSPDAQLVTRDGKVAVWDPSLSS